MAQTAMAEGVPPNQGPQLTNTADLRSARRPTRSTREPWRVPLHLLAALCLAILLVVMVTAFGAQTYRGVQDILRTVAYDETRFIREALSEKVQRILEPAESQLALLAYSDLSTAATLPQRLGELPLILEALKRTTLIDASFVGYPNGEFILFRPLRNDEKRAEFKAPDRAVLVVQSVTRDAAGVMHGLHQFFDADGRLLDSVAQPGYRFDPRTRPWYKAVGDVGAILTEPYPFFTTQEIGATMARRSPDGKAVVGLDVTMRSIADALKDLRITPSTELAVIDAGQQVIGYHDAGRMIAPGVDGGLRLARIAELGSPVLAQAATALASGEERGALKIDGRGWQVMRAGIPGRAGRDFTVLIAIPNDELFAAARQIVGRQVVIGVLILLVAIAIGWWGARRLTRSLHLLVRETKLIRSFDFSSDTKVPTILSEVDNLARALDTMKGTIRKFMEIDTAVSAERDLTNLLERILRETTRLATCDGGVLYLLDKEGRRLEPEIARWHGHHVVDEHIALPSLPLEISDLLPQTIDALKQGQIVVVDRQLTEAELEALGLSQTMEALGAERVGLVAVPLLNRKQAPLGVLLSIKAIRAGDAPWSVNHRLRELIRAVSGSAGIAIENHQLLQAQKDLMNALIKLIAGAIDAKSAYTGGHCQRVPVLTRMLAEAACSQKDGAFADFRLSDEEWEAVDIGSWLHDCGKVTTPEYVVDKATKLETIYDRIHEVRMRFEVLKRDAEIGYWQAIAKGGDPDALRERMECRAARARRGLRVRGVVQRGWRVHGPGAHRAPEADRRAHLAPHARRPARHVLRRARAQGSHGRAEPAGRRAAAGRPRGPHHAARAARDD